MLESEATLRAILYGLPSVIIHVNTQNDMCCCGNWRSSVKVVEYRLVCKRSKAMIDHLMTFVETDENEIT